MEQRESNLQQLMLHFDELQQRHVNLEQKYNDVKHHLATLQACPLAETMTAPGSLVSAQGAAACEECRCLLVQVAELLQRQADLETEMSDVQAACNVATAEKHTLERAMVHRQANGTGSANNHLVVL